MYLPASSGTATRDPTGPRRCCSHVGATQRRHENIHGIDIAPVIMWSSSYQRLYPTTCSGIGSTHVISAPPTPGSSGPSCGSRRYASSTVVSPSCTASTSAMSFPVAPVACEHARQQRVGILVGQLRGGEPVAG